MSAAIPTHPRSSRLRRRGAAWAATVVSVAAVAVVTAVPAHATTDSISCNSGSYKPAIQRLGAFECEGTPSTDVFVFVANLVVVNGQSGGSGTLFCTDFGPEGVPGHWAGDC